MTDTSDSLPAGTAASDSRDSFLGELARQAYDDRRRRDSIPGTAGLFGEPAWDLLLYLFIGARENRKVSLDEACKAAGIAASPALRWIAILEKQGLVVRAGAPQQGSVKLSLKGYAALADYFRRV